MDFTKEDWKRFRAFASVMESVKIVDDCWITKTKGRSQHRINGIIKPATHVTYAAYTGKDVSKSTHMRHICSNKKCVNPKHLIPGTSQQNMEDKKYPPILDMIKYLKKNGYKIDEF